MSAAIISLPGCGLALPDMQVCEYCDCGEVPVQGCCGRRKYYEDEFGNVFDECCGNPDIDMEPCEVCLQGRRLLGLRDHETLLQERLTMSEKKPGDLPSAVDAKWAAASLNRGTWVDMGDVVVCDLCMTDYRNRSDSGGFIVGATAVGPCCSERYLDALKRNHETSAIRGVCRAGESFQQFVLHYRKTCSSNSIGVFSFDSVDDLQSVMRPAVPKLDELRDAVGDDFAESSDHPYTCRCDKCLSWWAKMGPDGGEGDDYGPFSVEEVEARQRELGIER